MLVDYLQPFSFERSNLRGAIVRLNKSYQTIMRQHNYPEPVQKRLAETLLSSVLLASSIKFEGQLTIQFNGDGPLKLLVAKCDHQLQIRGLAQFALDADLTKLKQHFAAGSLVVTLEFAKKAKPYQSIIPINGQSISGCIEHYFSQSEQLATKIFLSADHEQAAGMLLQVMPGSTVEQTDNFAIYAMQLAQLSQNEHWHLQDNADLLKQLNADEDIRLYQNRLINFHCPCNLERMKSALKLLPKQEALEEIALHKQLVITCEYCAHEYQFNRDEIEAIYQDE